MTAKFFKSFFRAILRAWARRTEPHVSDGAAVLFSPHFDDEILGAGGILAARSSLGLKTSIAFMADGSGSHSKFMDRTTLAKLRKSESAAAAAEEGVSQENLVYLDYPEGHISEHIRAAVDDVLMVLAGDNFTEVYIPHGAEPRLWSADHLATHAIVRQALAASGFRGIVREYPVWMWYSWPWTDISLENRGEVRRIGGVTAAQWFGMRPLVSLNRAFPLIDVRKVAKRKALEAYGSQMRKPEGESTWPVLGDIANGSFLDSFFDMDEYFLEYRIHGN